MVCELRRRPEHPKKRECLITEALVEAVAVAAQDGIVEMIAMVQVEEGEEEDMVVTVMDHQVVVVAVMVVEEAMEEAAMEVEVAVMEVVEEAMEVVIVWLVLATHLLPSNGTFLAYQFLRRIFTLSIPMFPNDQRLMLKIGDALSISLLLDVGSQR
jgi:hypothetical protein